jgi:hypothetical protein
VSRAYVCAWVGADGQEFAQLTTDPVAVLSNRRGMASPLFAAIPTDELPDLPSSPTLAFLVPTNVSQFMAYLTNDVDPKIARRAHVCHGHSSCVLVLDSEVDWESVRDLLTPHLRAWEVWSVDDMARSRQVDLQLPVASPGWTTMAPVDDAPLSNEARNHVRQFNLNMKILDRTASEYAPEIAPLVESLRASVNQIVLDIAELISGGDPSDSAMRQALDLEGVIVEANAVVTLYSSQLASGTLPLRSSTFPVGEYSLLGLGGMLRGVWRLYSQINSTFEHHDHIGTIRRAFPRADSFDPFAPSDHVDYSQWRGLKANVG